MGRLDSYVDLLTKYGTKLAISILIILAGKFIANKVKKISRKAMEKAKVDEMVGKFLGDLIYYALFIISIVVALNTLGMRTTSIAAVIGAATLAIGLSLQNNLSNLGSGVMILMTKPFKVSDTVEIGGIKGVVDKVSIFNTRLKTPDNKVVYMPNAKITGSEIINYSAEDNRRLDIVVGIGYEDDIRLAKDILKKIAESDARVLKEPGIFVGVLNLGASSIDIGLRMWVNKNDYFNLNCDILEKIKEEFDKNGINIPYPQMDISIKKVENV
ncbi:mechanosensitive ion channel [Deferribacteraceae bacterium V6Fe1]|nr:mechanosensitive ion channel [Deferribacteraceae bacterium V6Fe1]